MSDNTFDTIVLGGGPAGSGLFIAAARYGSLMLWLNRGVLWAERGASIGPGQLPHLAIASDTMAKVLLEALDGDDNPLGALRHHPLAEQLRELGERSLPLPLAGRFLGVVGERLIDCIQPSAHSALWLGEEARSVHRLRDGRFEVHFASGKLARARRVVLALGGEEDLSLAMRAQLLAGSSLSRVAPDRLMPSSEVFAHGGVARIERQLLQRDRPAQIVIVGGSHSAVCAADLLLRSPIGTDLQEGGIKLLCRTLPRPFYLSAAEASADGFSDFTAQDICPVTGRVYRLAGLRMASRELLRAIRGLGGLAQERRVALCLLSQLGAERVNALLDEADLVISAVGYRPRAIAFVDARDAERRIAPGGSYARPRVDELCRVLDAAGSPIDGLFGVGLASGFVPSGPVLGGEPSFRGQTNGIWLYQHDLGRLLLAQLQDTSLAQAS